MKLHALILAGSLLAGGVFAAVRDVQIRSVDFEADVVEVHNFGVSSQSISGWKLSTQDDDQALDSLGSGLAAMTLNPGDSLFIHWNDDKPAGVAGHTNRSEIGLGIATPLDQGPFGIGLYYQAPPFGDGSNMADYVQWNVGGTHFSGTSGRGDEAAAGTVWRNDTEWVSTSSNSSRIVLTDYSAGELHGPTDYTVIEPEAFAWWRFDEGQSNEVHDLAGHVSPGVDLGIPTQWENPRDDLIYDLGRDARNRYAVRRPLIGGGSVQENFASTSDWTVETIHQFNHDGQFVTFLDIAEGIGVGTTNTSLTFGWTSGGGNDDITMWLRDAEELGGSSDFQPFGRLNADGCWHHVAVVKRGASMRCYIDTILTNTVTLSSCADGNYVFTTNHNVSIGISLNNANSSNPSNIIDELRLTLKALEPHEFIHPARPLIRSFTQGSPNWDFESVTISGMVYDVELNADLNDPGAWDMIDTFNADGPKTQFSITAPTNKSAAIRVIRK